MVRRACLAFVLLLFACAAPGHLRHKDSPHQEMLVGLPDECESYATIGGFGPRVEELLAGSRIHPVHDFGEVTPLGISGVLPGGLAAEVGFLDGDIILEAAGVTPHTAKQPLWFFCLVDSGRPFDVRVQRFSGEQESLVFPAMPQS